MSVGEALPPTFYGQHQEQLNRLFDIVGLPESSGQSLPSAVEATQPWVKGDHSRPEHRFSLAGPDSDELFDIYGAFGLRHAHDLPAGQYSQAVVLGGIHRGNNRRLEFVGKVLRRGDVAIDDVALLGGQRRVYPEVELDTIQENLDDLAESDDPWLDSLQQTPTAAWWETDLLRLAALVHLGPLAVAGRDYRDLKQPYRPHVQTLSWQGTPLSIMHTKAVARQGEPRHTTEACVRDWLATAQPAQNAKVAFIGANPHLIRMGRSAQAVLRAQDRADIDLVVAGPASNPQLGHSHYLGEIARHLYEDQRLLKAAA